MFRTAPMFMFVATALLAIGLYGCNSSSAPSSPPTDSGDQPAASDNAGMDHAGMDMEHAGMDNDKMSDMDKMHATLAKLPEADRASAEKQHVCPVSGQMLGVMGLPIKVTVKGQDVWLCCEGCKEKIMNDPDTYLAKLKK